MGVLDVPLDRLATTLAPLRGPRTDRGTSLAPLPLRVAPVGDGTYEVLDGFKRLACWRREGHTHVPVVVEDAGAGVVCKARMLEANTPRRTASDSVLELGCGYGRVAFRLAEVAARILGIDAAPESLALARQLAGVDSRCEFLLMDASALTFGDQMFDVVVCIQNGICAFAVNPEELVREGMRVLRPGGRALFSTYAAEFWSERLRWFECQAAAGLVGEIDYDQTMDGTVVCKDGFRSATFSPEAFRLLSTRLTANTVITNVDASSVFYEIVVATAAQQQHAADGASRRR
jgi:SAM-dependent methyltransferase